MFAKALQLSKTLAFGLVFIGVVCVQFFYDANNLPIGFESAKVQALQTIAVIALLYILLLLPLDLWQQYRKSGNLKNLLQKLRPVLFLNLPVLLAVGLIVWSIINSPFQTIAVEGNPFRYSGLWTILALFVLLYFSWAFSQTKFLKILLLGYLALIILHAILGYVDVSSLDWELIKTGNYVNGNFGQANFFGNTIATGIIIATVYCLEAWRTKDYKLISVLLLAILILSGVLILSFSYGTWVILPVVLGGYLLVRFSKLNSGRKLLLSLGLLTVVTVLVLVGIYQSDEARRLTWDAVVVLIAQRPFWGYGPDTLSYALQAAKLLPDRFIDRSHNIILDLIFNFGILILPSLALLVSPVIHKLWRIKIPNTIQILILGLVLYFLTDLFHTKSVFHYAEVFMFTGILLNYVTTAKSDPS